MVRVPRYRQQQVQLAPLPAPSVPGAVKASGAAAAAGVITSYVDELQKQQQQTKDRVNRAAMARARADLRIATSGLMTAFEELPPHERMAARDQYTQSYQESHSRIRAGLPSPELQQEFDILSQDGRAVYEIGLDDSVSRGSEQQADAEHERSLAAGIEEGGKMQDAGIGVRWVGEADPETGERGVDFGVVDRWLEWDMRETIEYVRANRGRFKLKPRDELARRLDERRTAYHSAMLERLTNPQDGRPVDDRLVAAYMDRYGDQIKGNAGAQWRAYDAKATRMGNVARAADAAFTENYVPEVSAPGQKTQAQALTDALQQVNEQYPDDTQMRQEISAAVHERFENQKKLDAAGYAAKRDAIIVKMNTQGMSIDGARMLPSWDFGLRQEDRDTIEKHARNMANGGNVIMDESDNADFVSLLKMAKEDPAAFQKEWGPGEPARGFWEARMSTDARKVLDKAYLETVSDGSGGAGEGGEVKLTVRQLDNMWVAGTEDLADDTARSNWEMMVERFQSRPGVKESDVKAYAASLLVPIDGDRLYDIGADPASIDRIDPREIDLDGVPEYLKDIMEARAQQVFGADAVVADIDIKRQVHGFMMDAAEGKVGSDLLFGATATKEQMQHIMEIAGLTKEDLGTPEGQLVKQLTVEEVQQAIRDMNDKRDVAINVVEKLGQRQSWYGLPKGAEPGTTMRADDYVAYRRILGRFGVSPDDPRTVMEGMSQDDLDDLMAMLQGKFPGALLSTLASEAGGGGE